MTDNTQEPVSSTTSSATPDTQGRAGQNGRKAEGERRAFEAAPAPAKGPPTNLEAFPHTAPAQAPYEIGDVWRDVFGPLLAAQTEAHRWFGQAWRQAANGMVKVPELATAWPFLTGQGLGQGLAAPAADLKETDRAYELSVELPGLSREDVEVKVERDAIRIAGHKAEAREEARADYRVSERRYGQFERSFPIPPDVRRDAISASCKDGVLKVVLPKTEAAQSEARRIEIR